MTLFRAFRGSLAAGLGALSLVALGADASAAPINPQKLDITGMTPKLVTSRDGNRAFLLAASPSGKVRRFSSATLAWDSAIPDIEGMSGIDTGFEAYTCAIGECFGGPSLAVGESDVLHVLWGEAGDMGCDPDTTQHFTTSVRLKYTEYDGSSWSSPFTVIERPSEDDPECGYQYPNLAEDGTGKMLVSYMHGKYVSPGVWDEGTHYFTYENSTTGWQNRGRIGAFAQWTHSTGGFGRLVLGYALAGQDHVAEINAATGDRSPDDQISSRTSAPYLLFAGSDDLHASLTAGVCSPDCYTNSIYYSRRTGSGWAPKDELISNDSTIFAAPPPGQERTAVLGLAVTSSGKRLMTFSYANKLYFVTYNGTKWAAPEEIATGNDVSTQAVVTVGSQYYLVVWSTGLSTSAEIWYALVPTGEPVEPDGGTDAGLDSGGDVGGGNDGGGNDGGGNDGGGAGGGAASPDAAGGSTHTPLSPGATQDDSACGCRMIKADERGDRAWLATGLMALCGLIRRRPRRLARRPRRSNRARAIR